MRRFTILLCIWCCVSDNNDCNHVCYNELDTYRTVDKCQELQVSVECAMKCSTYDSTLHEQCTSNMSNCGSLRCPMYQCDLHPCLEHADIGEDPCDYTAALLDCAEENYCLTESHIESCKAQQHNCPQLGCPALGGWWVTYLNPLFYLGRLTFYEEASYMQTVVIAFWIFGAIACVTLLSNITAPYGRYANDRWSFLHGPSVPGKAAWVIQECPCVIIPVFLMIHDGLDTFFVFKRSSLLLGLFLFHYIQRTFIFPLLIRGGKPTRLFPFLMAVAFCCCNGWLQSCYLLRHWGKPYELIELSEQQQAEAEAVMSPVFIIGVVVFFCGMFINIQSDSILRNLRKPGESGYKIPQGGMFTYVSGANFLGEIIEWIGFSIASGFSIPSLTFAAFTLSNIGPRGYQHHQWYIQKFDNYPKQRKAVIPFVW